MKTTVRLLLPLIFLAAGCSTLGSGDLATLRAVSQGRYDEIETVALVLDKLAQQPVPSNLTPEERVAWNEQTNWLTRTRTKLLTFRTGMKRVLDAPMPGSGIDGAIATAQLASDFAKLSEDFTELMKEITVESQADRERIEKVSRKNRSGRDTVDRADSADSDKIALSTPLKSRHDAANSAISGLS